MSSRVTAAIIPGPYKRRPRFSPHREESPEDGAIHPGTAYTVAVGHLLLNQPAFLRPANLFLYALQEEAGPKDGANHPGTASTNATALQPLGAALARLALARPLFLSFSHTCLCFAKCQVESPLLSYPAFKIYAAGSCCTQKKVLRTEQSVSGQPILLQSWSFFWARRLFLCPAKSSRITAAIFSGP